MIRLVGSKAIHATIVLIAVLQTGCFGATIRSSAPTVSAPQVQHGVSFFWGLTPVSSSAVECHHGLAQAHTIAPWWGVIVSSITLGLLTPWEMEYYCAQGSSRQRYDDQDTSYRDEADDRIYQRRRLPASRARRADRDDLPPAPPAPYDPRYGGGESE